MAAFYSVEGRCMFIILLYNRTAIVASLALLTAFDCTCNKYADKIYKSHIPFVQILISDSILNNSYIHD